MYHDDNQKCPVYLKLPWIGNVSSKFENQINKAIASCFYAVKPRVVYSTRVVCVCYYFNSIFLQINFLANNIHKHTYKVN